MSHCSQPRRAPPTVGQEWKNILNGNHYRVIDVRGSRVTIVSRETGNRETVHTSDLVASAKLCGVRTKPNPREIRVFHVDDMSPTLAAEARSLGYQWRAETAFGHVWGSTKAEAVHAAEKLLRKEFAAKTKVGRRAVVKKNPGRRSAPSGRRSVAQDVAELIANTDAYVARKDSLGVFDAKQRAAWDRIQSQGPKHKAAVLKIIRDHYPAGATRPNALKRNNPRRAAYRGVLVTVFGNKELEKLTLNEVIAVAKDVADMADAEFGGDEGGAAVELRKRIWGAKNLKSYAKSLVAGKRHMNPRSGGDLEKAKRVFEMWSELKPTRVRKMKGPAKLPKAVAEIGELVSVVYRSKKYDGKSRLYEHKTKSPRPVLAATPDGQHVLVVGGKMKITPDGLVN